MTARPRTRAIRRAFASTLTGERQILLNSGSMLGTALVTALLGAAFWLVAARHFDRTAVGVASAAVAAMTLLGFLATVGLGTLLMGELPRLRQGRRGMIVAAVAVAASTGAALGAGFALLAPLVSTALGPLRGGPLPVLAFATGAALTGAAFVLDQALIGMLRGGLQLARNIVFSLAKLLALLGVAAVAAGDDSVAIFGIWTAGIAVSLLVLARFFHREPGDSRRPAFSPLRRLRLPAATHHLFNLALRIPDLMLPILVVTLLSAATNASFYVAWMIASLIFAVPLSLSTVLYAVGSGEPARLDERFRLSVYGSLAFGLLANLALLAAAGPLLGLFGPAYAEEAGTALRVMALGVFAETVRTHYVSVHRIRRTIGTAMPIVWGGTLLELLGAAVGAVSGGLTGVAIGWLVAVCVEAVAMGPDVFGALNPQARRRAGQGVAS